jgi:hypothetical protein
MGIFTKRSIINEFEIKAKTADADENEHEDSNEEPTDYTQETPPGDGNEDNTIPSAEDGTGEDGEEPIDYTQDTPEGSEDSGENTDNTDPLNGEVPEDTGDPTDYTQETPPGDGNEDNAIPPAEDSGDTGEDGEEPIDYTQDTPDGTEDSGATGEDGEEPIDYTQDTPDEGGDDSGTGEDYSNDDSTSNGNNELKDLENQLFSSLTPEQIEIRNIELKRRYIDMYETIVGVTTRINKIAKTDTNLKVLEFVTNKLVELKDMVSYNLTDVFDSRTYIENCEVYQQCVAILNTINEILKELTKKGK